ncbi:Kre1p Ecym_2020 [Eremothecium cymbalariae DBVPG|uniref:Uncharacterized protein n=1 Tax=Eremothecium cymbalariae (strain CBS 270.75 / DBVPG 7215 / KCTC 17166 / NRRL Y-17582) TaxID=931890 RepID=G8JNX9_ERECY|nr:Hypothetical protein Ecym_2020 [Eremothecium cymbalariae DBVPG\
MLLKEISIIFALVATVRAVVITSTLVTNVAGVPTTHVTIFDPAATTTPAAVAGNPGAAADVGAAPGGGARPGNAGDAPTHSVSAVTTPTEPIVNSNNAPDPSTTMNTLDSVPTDQIDLYVTFVTDGVTTTALRDPTLIWYTFLIDGKSQGIKSAYHQYFTSQYNSVETPSSGSIGLGSIQGAVGSVKAPTITTLTDSSVGGQHALSPHIGSLSFILLALIGLL